MNTELEERLRTSMRSTTSSTRQDWPAILGSADRRGRRSSNLFRMAIASFVAILGFSLWINGGTIGIESIDPAAPTDAPATTAPLSNGPLFVAIVLTTGLALLTGMAMFRRPVIEQPTLVGWRRWWPILLLPTTLMSVLLIFWSTDLFRWEPPILPISALSVPCVPALIWLLAERIAERPKRWRIATFVWISLGVVCVLWTRWFIVDLISLTDGSRLWPTETASEVLQSLDHPPDDSWTPARIFTIELIAVVIIAITVGSVLRSVRTAPKYAAIIVPVVVWTMLGIYQFIAPLSFVFDYDTFFGDLVLGGTFASLTFVLPMDLIGYVAIALASLSMGLMIHAWGGPVRPASHDFGVDPDLDSESHR